LTEIAPPPPFLICTRDLYRPVSSSVSFSASGSKA
jgi:hypothetical protein